MKRNTIIAISLIIVLGGAGVGIFIWSGSQTGITPPEPSNVKDISPPPDEVVDDTLLTGDETTTPPVEDIVQTTDTATPEPTAPDTATDVQVPQLINYFIIKDWQVYSGYHILFFEFGFEDGVTTTYMDIEMQVRDTGTVDTRSVTELGTPSINDYIVSDQRIVSYSSLIALKGYLITSSPIYFVNIQNYMRAMLGDDTIIWNEWVGHAFTQDVLLPDDLVIPSNVDYFWIVSSVTINNVVELTFEWRFGIDITRVVINAYTASGQVIGRSVDVLPEPLITSSVLSTSKFIVDSNVIVATHSYLTTRSHVYFVDIQNFMRSMTGDPALIWNSYIGVAITEQF